MPGMIVLPDMSIRVAPAGILTAAGVPTAATRPFVITMVAWGSGAAPVPSITRAPVSAMVPPAGACASDGWDGKAAVASNRPSTGPARRG